MQCLEELLEAFWIHTTLFVYSRGSEGGGWDSHSAAKQSHPAGEFPEADWAAERPDWNRELNSARQGEFNNTHRKTGGAEELSMWKASCSLQEFIREGCLYKLTKKGLQQRMFFLVSTKHSVLGSQQNDVLGNHLFFCQFSDMLLYTSKGVTATNQFKVHGQLPLHGMIVSTLAVIHLLSMSSFIY